MKKLLTMIGAAAVVASVALSSWAIDNPVAADYTLTEDETVDAALTVNSGVTVDLAGHKLTVKGLGTEAGTITSTDDVRCVLQTSECYFGQCGASCDVA